MSTYIQHDHQHDGIDRKGFLTCMAWAGTGVVWALSGGQAVSVALADGERAAAATADFSFVQISDSHIGFHLAAANKNVIGTFGEAIRRINALPQRPAFVLHTGDHVHLSKVAEFDTVKQLIGTIKTDKVFHVPGEHDVFVDQGKRYLQYFGQGARGSGYYSFDYKGVHFLALANVQQAESETGGNLKGLGLLGAEQLAFIGKDLAALSSDTPLVLFGHVPLLAVYPKWGWATQDSAQVLAQLKRFSSVTVLNGHIHQILSKSEGNITMYTAASTACPQHAPGVVAPGPFKVPTGKLLGSLGLRTVQFTQGSSSLALKDESLAPPM
jgi:hypothetical protein